jgi:hypothetical protein
MYVFLVRRMVFLAGLALGGMGVVGGIAVWQRLWFLLLKVPPMTTTVFRFAQTH